MATDVQRLDNLRTQLAALASGEARVRVEVELGELLLGRGDYGQALVHLGGARAAAGDGKLRQRIELATGIALMRRGELERAEPHFERHLSTARTRRDRDGEAHALLRLGEIYRRRGEAARAATALERARGWFEAHPTSEPLSAVYANLAELALAAGDLDGAMKLAGDAADLATGVFAAVEEIAALLTVGKLLQRRKDWAGAEAAVARALELAGTADLPRELAEASFAYAHLVAAAGKRLDVARVGAPAAWIARAQELFKEHGALGDLERVRAAFRAFGRRATDRVAMPAVGELSDELQRARRELAGRAHQLVDAVAQGIDRLDDELLPPARARLHAVGAAALEHERGVTGGVEALADAEGRVLAALQSLVVERENMRTLLDQIRALNAVVEPEQLLREACKSAAQLTGADRCVVALLDGETLVAHASLRMADVEADPRWRHAMRAVIEGAGPMLVAHGAARAGDRAARSTTREPPATSASSERSERNDRGERNDRSERNDRGERNDGDQRARNGHGDDGAGEPGGSEVRLGKALATPVRHGEVLFGAVYVDKELCGGLFGPHELELLSSLCAQLATMLANARRGGDLRRDLRARAATLDAVADGVLAFDGNGALLALNSAAARILGVDGKANLRDLPALAFVRSVFEQGAELEPRPLMLGGGAYFCSVRPLGSDGDALTGALVTLTPTARAQALAQRLLSPPARRAFGDVIGRAPSLRRRLQLAEAAARGDRALLITGEPGSGKKLLAEAIHNASPFRDGPFLVVSCAAAARDRLERELFGAADSGPGKLELAAGGSLLLDEIVELPLDLQARLVQFLDSKPRPRASEPARLIATSSDELAPAVEQRRFRRDLWQRLSEHNLALPPLRSRRGDVRVLIDHFVPLLAARLGKRVRTLAPPLLEALEKHAWPGNVRELEKLLELEVARAADSQTRLERIPESLRAPPPRPSRETPTAAAPPGKPSSPPSRTLAETEKELLLRALADHDGSIPAVARQLGISRGTVYNKLRSFSIDAGRFRP